MSNRLLQINSGDSGGGAVQISRSLHDHLKSTWDTKMLVSDKRSQDNSIQSIASPRILTYLNLLAGLEYIFYFNTFWLQRRLEFKMADIVHYHNLHGYYFNLLALPGLTRVKPSLWTFHDMWPLLGHTVHSLDCVRCEAGLKCQNHKALHMKLYTINTSALLYKIKRYLLLKSKFEIVVPSRWLKHKVEQSFLKDRIIHVIYNGIDTEQFKIVNKVKTRTELNLPLDKTIILFSSSTGLTNTLKGSTIAQTIIDKFIHDSSIQFVSIGGVNEQLSTYKNLLQIPFVQDRAKLAKYYGASDIFLSPSLAESFGLSIAEAMSCGVPVVSFKVGAIPELVDHLENGYLAQNQNVNDLEIGIRYILKHVNRDSLVNSARKKIVDNFTLDQMITNYEILYRRLLNQV